MAIRFISTEAKPKPVVRTRSVTAPLDCGISLVTRAEYEALLARVEALEAVTKAGNAVTRVTKPSSNGNALTAAEKQRRYRERKRQSGG